MNDRNYPATELDALLKRGPQPDEDFFRVKATGNGETRWFNVSIAELVTIADFLNDSRRPHPTRAQLIEMEISELESRITPTLQAADAYYETHPETAPMPDDMAEELFKGLRDVRRLNRDLKKETGNDGPHPLERRIWSALTSDEPDNNPEEGQHGNSST